MRLLIPGKTFLLGEYAVLEGGGALLLGHGPRFEAILEPGEAPAHPFHPASPAGLWLAAHPYSGKIAFRDPRRGLGGFGGSGAEFVAAWRAGVGGDVDPWAAWDASRAFPGSGADILTQTYGLSDPGDFLLSLDIPSRTHEKLRRETGLVLSLFHTGKKIATHEALRRSGPLPARSLTHLVGEGTEALRGGNAREFARTVQRYGEAMAELGLIAPHTAAALAALPPGKALAAKGCGAMGADVILVVHEGADFAAWAEENSLAPMGEISI